MHPALSRPLENTPAESPSADRPMAWTNGLSALQKFFLQAGAVGVVCLLLAWGQFSIHGLFRDLQVSHREELRELQRVHREDLLAFQAELKAERDHDARQRDATNVLIVAAQRSIDDTQRTLIKTLQVIETLAREIKSLKQ